MIQERGLERDESCVEVLFFYVIKRFFSAFDVPKKIMFYLQCKYTFYVAENDAIFPYTLIRENKLRKGGRRGTMRAASFDNRDRLINIGLAIASFRGQNGMTQDELAAKAGVSRTTISEIEASGKARNFSIDCLLCIADVLNVSASAILKRAEDFA